MRLQNRDGGDGMAKQSANGVAAKVGRGEGCMDGSQG